MRRGWPSGSAAIVAMRTGVRQELAGELGVSVNLRTVERAVASGMDRANGMGTGSTKVELENVMVVPAEMVKRTAPKHGDR